MRRRLVNATMMVALTCAGAMAADELPKAETILDKAVEVTGGKAAYQKIHNEVSTGTMSIAGMSGTATIYKAEPDKTLTDIVFQGLGTMKEGSNGTVAWSLSAMQGPRVKDGEEKETALMMARFDSEVNWRAQFPKAETVGTESVDGKECYKVVLTPKVGKPMTRFYDKQTGLLVKSLATLKSAMGEISVESAFDDYRKEGDILMAHKLTNKAMGQQFSITIDKVEYNADIPASKFDLPDEIQALLKKDAEKDKK